MKFKQLVSAAVTASIAISSLTAMTITADAEGTMYVYNYEKTAHTVNVKEGGGDTVSGLDASATADLSLPGVTDGTTTYAQLSALYTGFTVEGFAMEECSNESFSADDFEIYTFLMHDSWEWKQVNAPTMTFSELGLSDDAVIQRVGYIVHIKDSALVDSDLQIGDTILVNNGNAKPYTYSYSSTPHEITIKEGGDDVASGQWAAVNTKIALPDITCGTTTFAQLKEAYISLSIGDFKIENCTIDSLTAEDFEIYIYLMHDEGWTWVQTWENNMVFADQKIDNSSVIQEIGYVLRIKESTLVNLGLSIGDTVSINKAESSVNAYFENDVLYWDEVSGATGYTVKVSDDTHNISDRCFLNNSTGIVPAMRSNGFKSGVYSVEIYAVDGNGTETLIATVDYTFQGFEAVEGENIFTYMVNADNTITITGGVINDKDVVIPSTIDGKTVSEIGDNAFSSFNNTTANTIETLVISEGVKKLGWYAFNTCENLKSVTLPQSLEYIDRWAFERCYALTTINVPSNVSVINGGAFAQNTSMTSITCDTDNANYVSVNGVLFSKDMSALIAYPGGLQGSYTIPASVNHIDDAAFYGAKGITAVEILGVLDFIGFEAFAECELLTDVKINEGVTYVGYHAFRGCKGIKQLTVPQSVTNIGHQAFGYDSLFAKAGDFTLRGYENSAIHFYAIRHDIPFIVIGEVSEEYMPFIEENKTTGDVDVNPDADASDAITSITVNPAFNLKDKSEMGVGLDLSDIKVKAKEIYDAEGIAKAEAALGQDIIANKYYNLLDITLMSGTTDISNSYDGLVKVIIPIPTGHRDKNFYCYRILDDGTKEMIPGKREGNDYVIYLEHFSVYAFVAGDEHICDFSEEWKTDEVKHWHECECGAISEEAAHTAGEWIVDREAVYNNAGSKHKECTVCGYTTETAVIPAIGGHAPIIIPTVTTAATSAPVTATEETKNENEETTEADITTDNEDDEIIYEEDETTAEEEAPETEIDEDTDTTKPADDSEYEEEYGETDGEEAVPEQDDNPVTGVALGLTGVMLTGAALILSMKKRTFNSNKK